MPAPPAPLDAAAIAARAVDGARAPATQRGVHRVDGVGREPRRAATGSMARGGAPNAAVCAQPGAME